MDDPLEPEMEVRFDLVAMAPHPGEDYAQDP